MQPSCIRRYHCDSQACLLMASSSDELTLPDGFPLAPKGCEKPSQKFFDCFTAAGMQKDVAVRSQRPKNKAWNGHAFRAAGRGRRRARPRGVRGAARRVPQVPGVARTKTAAAGRVPRARGVPARRRRVRRARVTIMRSETRNVTCCEIDCDATENSGSDPFEVAFLVHRHTRHVKL